MATRRPPPLAGRSRSRRARRGRRRRRVVARAGRGRARDAHWRSRRDHQSRGQTARPLRARHRGPAERAREPVSLLDRLVEFFVRVNGYQKMSICRVFSNGSDGTRTRDLRRDRRARRNRLQPATTYNHRLQQAFPRRANRLRPIPPASTRLGLCRTCALDELTSKATWRGPRLGTTSGEAMFPGQSIAVASSMTSSCAGSWATPSTLVA
jgi:hypothetical protein